MAMGLGKAFLFLVLLHTLVYVAHVNQVLNGVNMTHVLWQAGRSVVHFCKYNIAPRLGLLVPAAERVVFYPRVTRRDGHFSCVKFQYTGTGECPSNVNDIVALFTTPNKSESCDTKIYTSLYGVVGYCAVRNDETGEVLPVMHMSCYKLTMRQFNCHVAAQYASYGYDSLRYVHSPLALPSPNATAAVVVADASSTTQTTMRSSNLRTNDDSDSATTTTTKRATGSRGIAMAIHPGVLASAYASIKSLREFNCSLPIEVWYRPEEMAHTDAIVQSLVAKFNVVARAILDPMATRFFTKPYALFYSAFDNVLLLDCDNFAIRDPEYLFDTPEFAATGALFWPDYWKPDNTCFGIDAYSMIWDLTGIDFVDMFEQESAQLLVNKPASMAALHVLMFYSFVSPRFLADFNLVYGDKDLYRLAWLKAGVPFHMIKRPPGSVGRRMRQNGNGFCGKTMAQHDPQGAILFFHRNTDKMTGCASDSISWEYLQEFRYSDVHIANYQPVAYVLGDTNCFGHSDEMPDIYVETEIVHSPYRK
ncbi:hypothetical protein As57867_005691, partial [Aphanomyces stellatus]